MTGYVRQDTSNNIADGNVINAADFDSEFDGLQAAFNASTGHVHDGTTGNGAPILVVGPTQDVVVSATAVTPKTTNTVDIGSSSLKFKDIFITGTATLPTVSATTVGATTGNITTVNATTVDTTNIEVTTLKAKDGTAAGSIADSTGVVTLASSILTTADINGGTIDGTAIGASSASTGAFTTLTASSTATLNTLASSGATLTGGSINNMAIGGTTAAAASVTTLTTSSTVTHNGGTANGVAYLNGSKVLTTGSALTFDGTNLGVGASSVVSTYRGQFNGDLLLGKSTFSAGDVFTIALGDGNAFMQSTNGQPVAFGAYNGFTWNFASTNTKTINTEWMRLTSTGLGIGTSSPGQKLDVRGNINIGDGTNNANITNTTDSAFTLISGGTSTQNNIRLYGPSHATLANTQTFLTAGTERMRLDSSGNLGIGTSSPGAKLHVYKSNQNQLQLQCDDTGQVNINMGGTTTPAKGAIYFSDNSGSMWFNTASTQRMTLDSSGNLGLGVTPSAWAVRALQGPASFSIGNAGDSGMNLLSNAYYGTGWTYIASAAASWYQQLSGAHKWYTAPSGTAGNAISFTQAMTLNSAGNLILGSTTASTGFSRISLVGGESSGTGPNTGIQLTYNASTYGGGAITTVDAAGGGLSFYTFTGNVGSESYSERARIDSSGNLMGGGMTSASGYGNGWLLGPTVGGASAPAISIGHVSGAVSGSIYAAFGYNGSGIGSITQSGTTAVLYNTTSDQRLKENIQDADSASALIDSLQVRKYDWKADGSHQRYGFVAQELVTVAPEAVHQPADPEEMMAVDYSKLVPMLVKEIQSLRARVAQLESN